MDCDKCYGGGQKEESESSCCAPYIMSCIQNDSQCEMKLSIQRIFVGNTLLTLQTNGKIEINPVDRRPGINELGECRISVRDQKKALRIWNRTVV